MARFRKASKDRVGKEMRMKSSDGKGPAGGKHTGRKASYRHKGKRG